MDETDDILDRLFDQSKGAIGDGDTEKALVSLTTIREKLQSRWSNYRKLADDSTEKLQSVPVELSPTTGISLNVDVSDKDWIEKYAYSLSHDDLDSSRLKLEELSSLIDRLFKQNIESLSEYFNIMRKCVRLRTVLRSLRDNIIAVKSSDLEQLNLLISLDKKITNGVYEQKGRFAESLLRNTALLFAGIPLTRERIEFHCSQLIALFDTRTVDDKNKYLFEDVLKCCLTKKEELLNELENRVNNLRYLDYYRNEGEKLMREAEENKIKKVKLALASYEQYRAAARTLDKNGNILEIVELRKCMAKSLILADEFDAEAELYTLAAISILLKAQEERSSNVGLETREDLVKLLKSLQENHNDRISDDAIEDNDKLQNYVDRRIRSLMLEQYLSKSMKDGQNLDELKTVEKYPTIARFKHLKIPTMSYVFEIGINYHVTGTFSSSIIERMLNDPILSSYAVTHFPKVTKRSNAPSDHSRYHSDSADIVNELLEIGEKPERVAWFLILKGSSLLDISEDPIKLDINNAANHFLQVNSRLVGQQRGTRTGIKAHSFVNLLELSGHIAQISYFLLKIIETQNYDYTIIKTIKESMSDNQQFLMFFDLQIQALEDLLFAFGYFDDKSFYPLFIQTLNENSKITSQRLIVSEMSESFVQLQEIPSCSSTGVMDEKRLFNKIVEAYRIGSPMFQKIIERFLMDKVENIVLTVNAGEKCIHLEPYQLNFQTILPYKHSDVCRHMNEFDYLPKYLPESLGSVSVTMEPDSIHGHVLVPSEIMRQLCNDQTRENYCEFQVAIYVHFVTVETNKTVSLFILAEPLLNYLDAQLQMVNDNASSIHILKEIALIHLNRALNLSNIHQLDALHEWHKAFDSYNKIFGICPTDNVAIIGYARCLLNFGRYKDAQTFLEDKRMIKTNSADISYLLAVAKRKQRLYNDAQLNIEDALRVDSNHKEAKAEENVIRSLREFSSLRIEQIIGRSKTYDEYNTKSTSKHCSSYNILSIDGGGIRGVIPAIWLAEIERRTKKHCSDMFQMMAGTSTGAIIAAGLACPKPRHKAFDIVELYTTQGSSIFSRVSCSKTFQVTLKAAQYTNEGRSKLFNQYFGETKLSEALTDLVITSTRADRSVTCLSTRYDGRLDTTQNITFKDALMGTSAAPTYFPQYDLDGPTVDGGVQANNPSMIAYKEAIRYHVNKENVFILSLGTGDYIPRRLPSNSTRNVVFWYKNRESVMKAILDAPQKNNEQYLSVALGNNYRRWEVWLEKQVKLDDYSKENIKMLCELAYARVEEMEEYDNKNRLSLLIERLTEEHM
ncbi:unnamed protein product [Didymodactylos carnosus]|uniref:PNPLA domain-containing protein n=1 Tax=Didymodactylos carnosus TaxID=1234261 RepID=A0A814PXV0_9BILA|nr:unnamed protein product [Didymodactylos carnosus]CAF3876266.1 unnamed protein product [Didymodactylos carnosus]